MQQRLVSLDGARGLAILLVFLHHQGLLDSGWAGVDLFFVLSGYLITSILRSTRDDKRYWSEFYLKRVTRILPPFLLMLVALVALYWWPLRYVPAYLLSLGDLTAYYGKNNEATKLLWSLAVEEHFYLLWPFAVRHLQRKTLIALLSVVIVIEPLLRAWAIVKVPNWEFVYYLTPFRLDGISLGALLAVLVESDTMRGTLKRTSLAGVTAGCAIYAFLHKMYGVRFSRGIEPIYNGLAYSLIAVIAFFLIAHFVVSPRSVVSRIFSWKPIVFLGTLSYGFYLFHIPVRDMCMWVTGWPVHAVTLPSAVMALLISYLSFRFYERPFVVWGKRRAELMRESVSG